MKEGYGKLRSFSYEFWNRGDVEYVQVIKKLRRELLVRREYVENLQVIRKLK